MFDINTWLNEMIGPPDEQIPRHQRICFLVFANGGFDVSGWGVLSGFGSHQRGLHQEEAIELISAKSFFNGLSAAGVDVSSALDPHFTAYVQKHGH